MKFRNWLMLCCVLYVGSFAGARAGQAHIEVISKGFQHDFWKQVNLGCVAAGKEFGATVNFVGPENESDLAGQSVQLENAIKKTPTAICLAALSPETIVDLVYEAADKGIPVITFDSDIGYDMDDEVQAFVATDNREAGSAAAEHMYDALRERIMNGPYPVRIAVLSQDTISQSIGDRTFGFIERLVQLCGAGKTSLVGHLLYEKRNPDADVIIHVGIAERTVDEDMEEAVRRIFIHSDLAGAYASNEFAAKSMVNVDQSFNRLGPGGAVGIGFDSGVVQRRAVRDRVLYGSITQNPFMIGYLSVKTALEAARGETVADQKVPFYFYTADNMDEPDIAACLYD